ncbi:MAG TPA: arsinothricin resistance N-acetyltransferase ArsN1 family B [Vicinamibacterales bacterium]|jgi:phosphinothricin acetyltransferase
MSVRIRLASEQDADAIAAIYRPVVEDTAISFETTAPGREEMARRVAETLSSYPWLVCERDGRIAGYAYATRHRVRAAYQWSVDTSVYIDDADRRSGVGRGLYLSLFAILAAQGYFNAFAGIALPNPGSVALHEAMGFEKLGVYHNVGFKLGEWRDVGWWQLILRSHEAVPHEPLALDSVRRLPAWERLLVRGEAVVRAKAA